ncbi:hypothetical protein L208DRAFT_1463092 [Tricholoma matsutake]|nr:hypothetical protein L208DRAFT_1463092 [Tricholoma matsutake 945]
MEYFWDSLKDHVWASPSTPATPEDLTLFKEHGWELGLSMSTGIYIMDQGCTNPFLAFLSLYPPSESVIYTLGNGVQPGWSVHLYCQGCNTNYHNNFSVCNGIWTYYMQKPQYIQVGEHQFVENRVVDLWTGQMLLGWFSASNTAKLYDMALAGNYLQTSNWPLGTKLTTYHVWDTFIISALLDDHEKQDTVLQVPHTGDQKDRFKDAVEKHNNKFVLHGQPDAVKHVCNKCMCVFFMDGEY